MSHRHQNILHDLGIKVKDPLRENDDVLQASLISSMMTESIISPQASLLVLLAQLMWLLLELLLFQEYKFWFLVVDWHGRDVGPDDDAQDMPLLPKAPACVLVEKGFSNPDVHILFWDCLLFWLLLFQLAFDQRLLFAIFYVYPWLYCISLMSNSRLIKVSSMSAFIILKTNIMYG